MPEFKANRWRKPSLLNTEKHVRGKIVTTKTPMESQTGLEVSVLTDRPGFNPVIVVYLWGKGNKRDFLSYAKSNAVRSWEVQSFMVEHPNGGEIECFAYEVVGTPDQLNEVIRRDSVHEWHFCLNVRVPSTPPGSGPEKLKPQKRKQSGKKHSPPVIGVTREKGLIDQSHEVRYIT